jgi:YfiH family protein
MNPDVIVPDWPVPPAVRALVTTRGLGDMGVEEGKAKLRVLIPAAPAWYRQEHGTHVVEGSHPATVAADASFTRAKGVVCAVMAADCMPVLLAADDGSVVGAAHAGWRGLCAGVIEALLDEMRLPGDCTIAWLGPAIGPRAYEVGEEVRAAYLAKGDPETAFVATRPGHWLLDLYAVARRRLAARGVTRVSGGTFCTFSDARFYSYRRDRTAQRMAALVWLA